MAPRKCTICGQDIVLMPPASERAKKDLSGNSAQYYLDLFPDHPECVVSKRSQESRDLMARISGANPTHVILDVKYDEIPLEQRLRHARAH
jgi:hypothetical protein